MELRPSKHGYTCQQCDTPLIERWDTVPDGGITGGKEFRQLGMATCPKGHSQDWGMSDPL